MLEIKTILKYSKNLKVLYVEDNDDVRESTLDLMQDFFKEVDTADDGKIGLQKYIKSYKNDSIYDLVISDINMPNMDGIEMIKEIKKVQADQEVVVISAHNESEYLFELINIGVASFILKPLDLQQFMSSIYNISQKIYEHKFTLNYYKNIEKLNHDLNNSLRLSNTLISKEMLNRIKESDSSNVVKHEERDELIKFEKVYFSAIENIKEDVNRETLIILDNIFNKTLQQKNIDVLHLSLSKYISKMAIFPIFKTFCSNVEAINAILNDARLLHHKEVGNIFLLIESFIHMSNKYIDAIKTYNLEALTIIESNLNDDVRNITSLFEGKYTQENLSFFDMLNS